MNGVLSLLVMLTAEEKRFIEYWKENRQRKKKVMWQLAAGLPLGVTLVAAILINIFSGWFKGATATLQVNSSLLLTIIIAILLIVIFIVIFSAKHKWDLNEQRYQELLQQES
jgi:membrane protein YdbS with pleckstrin-like domain